MDKSVARDRASAAADERLGCPAPAGETGKVLIVEDDAETAAALARDLTDAGFVCETADDGLAALRKIEADPDVAVVVADLRLPGLDGIPLVRRLRRAGSPYQGPEVVLMTGDASRDEAVAALNAGALGFLFKPVFVDEVAYLCRRALDMVRRRQVMQSSEATLREALEQERELTRRQRDFISMISHEFRTPLAVIDSAGQRLLRRKDVQTPETIEKKAAIIRDAVARMVGLLDQNLEASRLDDNVTEFDPRDCDLASVLEDMCGMHLALHPGHRIGMELAALPPVIHGDPNLLRQVFDNLLSNAVKYAKAVPEIVISGAAEDGWAIVRFSDSGIGIPEDELPRIFERFYRARNSCGIAGTGIGLELAQRLVCLHGGSLAVESTGAWGTKFVVRLPVFQDDRPVTVQR